MDNQRLVELIRSCLAEVLVNNRVDVIDLLNKNGFPTNSVINSTDLRAKTLNAFLTNESFKQDMVVLMALNCDVNSLVGEGDFLNFASQPDGGGMISRLNANQLFSTVSPQNSQGFIPQPLFV
jgi:hypothetical protein